MYIPDMILKYKYVITFAKYFLVFSCIALFPCCTVMDARDVYYRDIKNSLYAVRGIKLVLYDSNSLNDYYYDTRTLRYSSRQFLTVSSVVFPKSEAAKNVRIEEAKNRGNFRAKYVYADYSHTVMTYDIDCGNHMAHKLEIIDFAKDQVLYKELDPDSGWKRIQPNTEIESLSNALCP